MTETNKYHIVSMILGLLITTPIWYYLLYNILKAINATQLVWFLFWVYVPVGIINVTISKIADMD